MLGGAGGLGHTVGVTRFTTAHPDGAHLSTEVVEYGPGIPTETELKLLGILDGKRVLDLGCGAGSAAVAMARQGAKVIAVDESGEQIDAARGAAEDAEVSVELHEAPLAELAFVRADSVDIALSVYGLAGLVDLDRLFRQVHRVLRTEQSFVFSVPHPAHAMLDDEDPDRVRRRYDDTTPREWSTGSVGGTDHPRTIHALLTSLGRANFRADAVHEPVPAEAKVPPTLVVRARKQGI